jgi:hypothetical protein
MTAVQYFWLADHNGWCGWFAISSPHIYGVLQFQFIGGVDKKKKKQQNLDI